MATTPTRLTIDDFELLPDEQVKNRELIDGELVDMGSNTPEHNLVRDWLTRHVGFFVEKHQLGVLIAEQEYEFAGNAHGPDLSFFSPAKRPLLNMQRRVQRFVPDPAIEVVSERQPFKDLVRKKDRYRKCGTAEVWIISPESREIYVYTEQGDRILRADAELTSPLIPGFQIRVSQIFETF